MNKKLFTWIDKKFREIDKKQIFRTKNIRLIPEVANRRGGKISYAEWAHVIGIFQTIMYQTLENKGGNHILDIGCGTGLLGIASEPFTANGGIYTGIDVMVDDINFCKTNFKAGNYKFVHFDVANPSYAEKQSKELTKWPIESDSQNLVTALSVWTHLSEPDAIFYFNEVKRGFKERAKSNYYLFLPG